MRSVAYIEDDSVVGLLKDFFTWNGRAGQRRSTFVVKHPSVKRRLAALGVDVIQARGNNLAEQLSRNHIDLLLIQSENLDHLTKILDMVGLQTQRMPTLVLTSHAREIRQCASFAHSISMRELLESNIRWHVQLAKTMRQLEGVTEHFAGAQSVAILVQDDPDPDAVASGLTLRQVLGRNKLTTSIGTFGRIIRPENVAMVKLLGIDVEPITRSRLKQFDRIAMVDTQPSHLSVMPHRIDLVIDHHPEECNYKAHIKDVRPSYGATSTILLEYLLCHGGNVGRRIATALLYGIKSDTFLLGRGVNEWDVEAFSFLYPRANRSLMRRIERPELPPAALDALSRALKSRHIIDRVAFVHLGRVVRDDLIPQMADFCLQFEGVQWAMVSGIYESSFVISVRNVGHVRSAGRVIKEAFGTVGSAGGHATMARAAIRLSDLSRKWNIDARNTGLLSRRVQREFLKSLRELDH